MTTLKYISFTAGVIADLVGGMLAIVLLLGFMALACTWVHDVYFYALSLF
jgi:hypothetical protein